jgi:hypothetical protein
VGEIIIMPPAKLLAVPAEPATALETLHRDRAGLADKLADLNRAAAKLRETSTAEAAVLAEIAALGAAEIEAMTKWGRGGCIGDAPRSDQNQRIKLGQKLNAAQASASAAVGAGQDIHHDIRQQTEQLALINDQVEQAVFDLVEREHNEVISEYVEACEKASQLATQISGLALLFRETGNNQRAAVIFSTKLPVVSTNPREVQLAADAWGRRITALRKGPAS